MATPSRDHDGDLTKTVTSDVIGLLFRNAIVARVRAEPRLLPILLEALVLASVVASLGRMYVGLPLSLCFFAVIGLFAEAILQVHFSDAHKLYKAWTTFRRQAYLTAGAFFMSRLALGEILGVPSPADVYATIQARGGLIEAFWNHVPPNDAVLEIVLDIPLVLVSMAAVVNRSKKALGFFYVLASVFIFFALLPRTRSAFHACIPVNGVVGCTWKLLFTGFK